MDREFRPYYMQIPFLDRWGEAGEERRDIEYMKRFYPKTMRNFQRIIEDECDKLEYDGSILYDEYPDSVGFLMLVNRICDKIKKADTEAVVNEEFQMEDDGHGNVESGGGPINSRKENDIYNLKNIISVMLSSEIYHSRCMKRRYRRWY